ARKLSTRQAGVQCRGGISVAILFLLLFLFLENYREEEEEEEEESRAWGRDAVLLSREHFRDQLRDPLAEHAVALGSEVDVLRKLNLRELCGDDGVEVVNGDARFVHH